MISLFSRRPFRSGRRHTPATALSLLIGVAAFAAGGGTAVGANPSSSLGPPQGAPLTGPQEGPVTPATALSCTRSVTVLIQVYQFFSEPVSNGCWGYNRSWQNAGKGNNTWKICRGDGVVFGSGVNRVFDDTSPANALSTETSLINSCGNLYAEDMARRSGSWCGSNGYPSPCWRRNAGTVVSVSRYLAELYSGDGAVDDQYSYWTATGYGANPSNSFGIWNIRPLVFNNVLTTTPLYNKIISACQIAAAHGGYFGIYAAAASGSLTTSQTDVNTVSDAMNFCTTS
jgi:hypothetical protein